MASIPRSLPHRPRRVPEPSGASGWLRARVLVLACAAQGAAWLLVVAAGASLGRPAGVVLPAAAQALLQGVVAAGLGHALSLPRWWLPLNLVLPLLAVGALALAVDPLWYLAAFALAFLIAGPGALRTGVPLYLSGAGAVAALDSLLPHDRPLRILDAGSGVGTVLATLSERRPNDDLHGVECAFGPWLVSRLRAARGGGRFKVRWGDFWNVDFGDYDVVYVFLSPAPMADLWIKAQREMRPGTLLVSYRFGVPAVSPTHIVPVGGARQRLLAWRIE